MNVLTIIPARGGSKGIPRKNIRILNGKPLIYYAISTILKSNYHPDVFVSSDDDEILSLSKKFGAETIRRKSTLSRDEITLDEVIIDAVREISLKFDKKYDLIITLQPTSPLLKTESIDEAISKMEQNNDIDTIISVINDANLTWKIVDGKAIPNYLKRVNRQFMEPVYKETGGFVISRRNCIENNKRFGENVQVHILKEDEAIDIDSLKDWNLCGYYLSKKTILFITAGNKDIGLGHVYRCLSIANNLTKHDLLFLMKKGYTLGYDIINNHNYNVSVQQSKNIIDDIKKIKPDVVINDILDTDADYVHVLRSNNYKVINFEDLGQGAKYADLVINALYPEDKTQKNHYFGQKYFIARDEFIYSDQKNITETVKNVLITFGGTDPNNLTLKVLKSIYDFCINNDINIHVIAGIGYENYNSINNFTSIKIYKDVKNISDYIHSSDVVFSSAGRTVYEIACIGTPTIIIAQNKRELSHFFAYEQNGFVNLGLCDSVSEINIREVFIELVNSLSLRMNANRKMLKNNIKDGRKHVLKLINNLLEEE